MQATLRSALLANLGPVQGPAASSEQQQVAGGLGAAWKALRLLLLMWSLVPNSECQAHPGPELSVKGASGPSPSLAPRARVNLRGEVVF